jgi:hypothetical protein
MVSLYQTDGMKASILCKKRYGWAFDGVAEGSPGWIFRFRRKVGGDGSDR